MIPWLPLLVALAGDGGCSLECGNETLCPDPCPATATECDVAYGPHPWQTLDVYLPDDWDPETSSRPFVLYAHGGSWYTGDKRCARVVVFLETLREIGYPVVSMNYELADPVENPGTWPQPIFDVKRALVWARTVGAAPPYELPGCVVATGTSSGGHLTALLGATWDVAELSPDSSIDPALMRPDLIVPFSAPTDFFALGCNGWCLDSACVPCPMGIVCGDFDGPGLDTFYELWLGEPWPERAPSTVPRLTFPQGSGASGLRCSDPPVASLLELTGNPYVDASPRFWLDDQDPPVFQFASLCDHLVPLEQITSYDQALAEAGIPHSVRIAGMPPDGCNHGFAVYGPSGSAFELDAVVRDWWPNQLSGGFGGFCR